MSARKLAIVRATVGTKMEGFPGAETIAVPRSALDVRQADGGRLRRGHPDYACALDV